MLRCSLQAPLLLIIWPDLCLCLCLCLCRTNTCSVGTKMAEVAGLRARARARAKAGAGTGTGTSTPPPSRTTRAENSLSSCHSHNSTDMCSSPVHVKALKHLPRSPSRDPGVHRSDGPLLTCLIPGQQLRVGSRWRRVLEVCSGQTCSIIVLAQLETDYLSTRGTLRNSVRVRVRVISLAFERDRRLRRCIGEVSAWTWMTGVVTTMIRTTIRTMIRTRTRTRTRVVSANFNLGIRAWNFWPRCPWPSQQEAKTERRSEARV